MRIAPGYNLNVLWYYEKGTWRIYRKENTEFSPLHPPGFSLAFPAPPFVKPWYWWAYLLMDEGYWEWQSKRRAVIGEDLLTDWRQLLITIGRACALQCVLTAGTCALVYCLASNIRTGWYRHSHVVPAIVGLAAVLTSLR